MNLFFIPYERWTIHTTLSAEEIQRRLAENVEKGDVYRSRRLRVIKTLYQGKLEADRFEIGRVIDYRQEFLPVVGGTLREESNRRAIDLVIKPQGVVLALFGIGIFAVAAGLCFMVTDAVSGTALPITAPLFLALLYTAYVVYFKKESARARKFLTGIFQ